MEARDRNMNIREIQRLVEQGYITKRYHGNGNTAIYNYTNKTQYEGLWTPETMACRGLVLDMHGNVVARPFDKIFNYGERGRFPSTDSIVNVTEKMDGSLGIGFYHYGQFYISTRGSFESEQAQWAESHFDYSRNDPEDSAWTFLLEIIYPDNRIVVDYGGAEGLWLLAMRNKYTGAYMPYRKLADYAQWYGFDLVNRVHFGNPQDIIANLPRLDANSEGWVAEFEDGSRFKFKGDEYVKLHKLISGLNFKSAVIAVKEYREDEYAAILPEEFLAEWYQWIADILTNIAIINYRVDEIFEFLPKETRKDFALTALLGYPKYAPYLFAKLDGKDVRSLIFKKEYGV